MYIDPQLVEGHINLGVVLSEQHRLADAIASHGRGIEIAPENAECDCTAPLRGFWRAIGSRAGTNTNGGSGTT